MRTEVIQQAGYFWPCSKRADHSARTGVISFGEGLVFIIRCKIDGCAHFSAFRKLGLNWIYSRCAADSGKSMLDRCLRSFLASERIGFVLGLFFHGPQPHFSS